MDHSKLKQETIDFVNQAFQKILGRSAGNEGISYFGNLLESGNVSKEGIQKMINDSPESQVHKFEIYKKKIPVFKTSFDDNTLHTMISSLPPTESASGWYHAFNFNNTIVKTTRTNLEYQMWVAQGIPEDLTGKTILDIGAADGFYSYLCESRGAEKVLAIDYKIHAGFDVAKKILNSRVEHKLLNVYELDKIDEKFDIVLLFGVYYHLENPVLALQKIASKVNDTLFLAGHIIDHPEPLMCYYDEYEMHKNDPTNWWVASPSCIIRIAKRLGFYNSTLLDERYLTHQLQSAESKSGIRKMEKVGTFQLSK